MKGRRVEMWECEDGTMVELKFDKDGLLVGFGEGVSKEDAEKAKKEIMKAYNIEKLD